MRCSTFADALTPLGLSVIRQLTRVVHLKLVHLEALKMQALHDSLLPLPPMLRRLELQGISADRMLGPGVQQALQAAANSQGCTLRLLK